MLHVMTLLGVHANFSSNYPSLNFNDAAIDI